MRNYTIKCEVNAALGIVTKILGTDNVWHLATNQAAKFESVNAARRFFFSEKADSVPPVCFLADIWIEGPRGGTYAMQRLEFSSCKR